MQLSRLGASASIVSLIQASLALPNIPITGSDLVKSFVSQNVKPIDEYLVQIDYPGVLTRPDQKTDMHLNKAQSVLEFNFTVHHKDTDQLILNELTIYPAKPKSQTVIEPLTAPHLIKNNDKKWEYASAVRLGYLVTELTAPRDVKHHDADQISIQVDIFQLAGKIFDKIQTIELQLVNNPSGKLMIEIAQTTASKIPGSIFQEDENCHSLLCKTKTGLSNFLTKAKGTLKSCHKLVHPHSVQSHPHSISQPQLEKIKPHFHSDMVPDLSNRLRKHHPKNRHPSFFRRAILPYLAPVVMGVLIGISSGIIGIIFGHAAIFIWTIVRRWNSMRYTSIGHLDIDDNEQDAFDGFYDFSQVSSSRENSIEIINEKSDE